ncbi:hypothetical protein NG891_00490 [Enterococcus gallinarum]|uniref:hypothetical protein n=1 Tax=Enterococcus gallinarum TaxID=1353 RepID=UPI002090EE80|nr:hypothetical protein [Enterococcus gallinarum]MCO5475195.1 hypothetical protein [Enterococcus gallinarum]
MNTKDNVFLVAIMFKLCFPLVKYAVKCGAIFSLCISAFISITPQTSPFLPFLYGGLYLTYIWTIWWHIRFVIRLIKKDKTWGNLGKSKKHRKVS